MLTEMKMIRNTSLECPFEIPTVTILDPPLEGLPDPPSSPLIRTLSSKTSSKDNEEEEEDRGADPDFICPITHEVGFISCDSPLSLSLSS